MRDHYFPQIPDNNFSYPINMTRHGDLSTPTLSCFE